MSLLAPRGFIILPEWMLIGKWKKPDSAGKLSRVLGEDGELTAEAVPQHDVQIKLAFFWSNNIWVECSPSQSPRLSVIQRKVRQRGILTSQE